MFFELQFHMEADPRGIEAWLIGHAVELAKAGRDPRAIRHDTICYGQQLRRRRQGFYGVARKSGAASAWGALDDQQYRKYYQQSGNAAIGYRK